MVMSGTDNAYRAPTRTYTYRQIDEASNNIANYLRDAGIQNGDAVMIFAHRSVELVCAYMGTLAAGAIVTVLDPQYPPQRQQGMMCLDLDGNCNENRLTYHTSLSSSLSA